MPRVIDDVLACTGRKESTQSGRVTRPSEKVQAMIEEKELEKEEASKVATEKAKRRTERLNKREQVAKAAQVIERRTANPNDEQGGVQLAPDKAFSFRSVGQPLVRHETLLATQLVARKGNVPPVMGKVINQGKQKMRPFVLVPDPKKDLGRLKAGLTKRKAGDGDYSDEDRAVEPRKRLHTVTEVETDVSDNDAEDYNINEDGQEVAIDQSFSSRSASVETSIYSDCTAPLDNKGMDVELDDEVTITRKFPRRVIEFSSDDDEPLGSSSTGKAQASQDKTPALSTVTKICKPAVQGGKNKNRARTSDCDPSVQPAIKTAIEIYRALLLTENPFPTTEEETKWVVGSLALAGPMKGVHKVELDARTSLLLTQRASHLRGQFKTRARAVVESAYGLEISADPTIIEKNRSLVEALLKDAAFTFRSRGANIDEHKGPYGHPAIQRVINEVLFKNKVDEGVKWARYYDPFLRAGFALAVTAIHCAIDEWAQGTRNSIPFSGDDYSPIHASHMTSLEEFEKETAEFKLLDKLLQSVFDNGCVNARVPKANTTGSAIKAVPTQVFKNAVHVFQLEQSYFQ